MVHNRQLKDPAVNNNHGVEEKLHRAISIYIETKREDYIRTRYMEQMNNTGKQKIHLQLYSYPYLAQSDDIQV